MVARVEDSFRSTSSDRQIFKFIDLFHNSPPYLSGSYDLFLQAEQWNVDSAAFIQESHAHPSVVMEKKISRVVGKGKKVEGTFDKDGKKGAPTYWIDIVRIWPASEEDVVWARNVICGVEQK